MTRVSGKVGIDAPHQNVWAALADLGAVAQFNPAVARSYYTSEQREGVGASRHCDLKPLGSIEERVVEWVEGESMRLEIYAGKRTPPFKSAHGVLSVRGDGDRSVASMTLDYELKYGPIGKLMDRIMVRRQFEKTVQIALGGLKRHLENGNAGWETAMAG